jgi:hypothetical protein
MYLLSFVNSLSACRFVALHIKRVMPNSSQSSLTATDEFRGEFIPSLECEVSSQSLTGCGVREAVQPACGLACVVTRRCGVHSGIDRAQSRSHVTSNHDRSSCAMVCFTALVTVSCEPLVSATHPRTPPAGSSNIHWSHLHQRSASSSPVAAWNSLVTRVDDRVQLETSQVGMTSPASLRCAMTRAAVCAAGSSRNEADIAVGWVAPRCTCINDVDPRADAMS